MKKNTEVHFAIFDAEDRVAHGFVGLRHYRSDLFILFVTSKLFRSFKDRIEEALENLKILLPDVKVDYHKVDLKDYWGTFFKSLELAKKISEELPNVNFFANISTLNKVASMAVRDALSALDRPAVCYYYRQGTEDEETSEIIEVPISPSFREIDKIIPILRSLYMKGGKADSLEDIAKDIGDKISNSENLGSQAKLIKYYIRKLEIHAIVRTVPGKKREILLTGASMPISNESGLVN